MFEFKMKQRVNTPLSGINGGTVVGQAVLGDDALYMVEEEDHMSQIVKVWWPQHQVSEHLPF